MLFGYIGSSDKQDVLVMLFVVLKFNAKVFSFGVRGNTNTPYNRDNINMIV